jgi:transcriptional regulator with XRE-family HTH domain
MSTLRNKRIAMGMRLIEAARELGTDPGNLSRIEAGTQFPRVDLAKRMASLYGLTLDEVFSSQPSDDHSTLGAQAA